MPGGVLKKDILKNFAYFTGKHLCLKKETSKRLFSREFWEKLWKTHLQNTWEWLFLLLSRNLWMQLAFFQKISPSAALIVGLLRQSLNIAEGRISWCKIEPYIVTPPGNRKKQCGLIFFTISYKWNFAEMFNERKT